MRLVLVSLAVAVVPAAAPAQSDPIVESREHYRAAVQAYEAGDRPNFLDHARRAQALRPAHGGVTWALASAQALSGDTAGALRSLRHYAALGYWGDVAADSDFAALRGTEAYAGLLRRLEANRASRVASTVAFELADPRLLVEGVAYDAGADRFFVSSVHQGRILAITRAGEASPFATVEQGRWAPLGLQVDRRRGALWVAAAALPQVARHEPGDSGRSAILRYELRSGRLAQRYEPEGTPHAIGDLVVSRNGDVYATDSRAPIVYRITAGSDSLERFLESPLLLSAQGLALTPDERGLYVADYARGVLRVDLASRDVTLMETADSALALGIDGLYFHRGSLIAIQNGVAPHRVTRLVLSPAGDRILQAEVLERAHPRHQEPTLGVVVDGALFYVANSQWERFGADGRIPHPDQLARPVVLRLPL